MLDSDEPARVDDDGVLAGTVLVNPKRGFELVEGCDAVDSAGFAAGIVKDANVKEGFSTGFSGAFWVAWAKACPNNGLEGFSTDPSACFSGILFLGTGPMLCLLSTGVELELEPNITGAGAVGALKDDGGFEEPPKLKDVGKGDACAAGLAGSALFVPSVLTLCCAAAGGGAAMPNEKAVLFWGVAEAFGVLNPNENPLLL